MTVSPLENVHRAIRSIAPPDVPAAGVLSTYGEETALFIPVEQVDTRLWECDGVEHVWAPIDLVRRAGGVDAVLPWCSTQLVRLLEDRRGEPLHGGEVVTLAVSLLRGVREAHASWPGDDAIAGRWWVSENGRPMFVRGDGTPVRAATSARLDDIAAACADPVVAAGVVRVRELIDAPGPLAAGDDMERALFHLASPRPVALASTGGAGTIGTSPMFAGTVGHAGAGEPPAWRDGAAGMRDRVAALWEGMRTRQSERARDEVHRPHGETVRSPRNWFTHRETRQPIVPARIETERSTPRSKRRLIVMSIVTAVTLLGVGASFLLDGGAESDDAVTPAPSSASPPAEAEAEAVSDPDARLGSDPVAAAEALLQDARACRDAGTSCEGVVADAGLLASVPDEGQVSLVDDYGGMAVVAVGDDAVTVLLERTDERWRIRDLPNAAAVP